MEQLIAAIAALILMQNGPLEGEKPLQFVFDCREEIELTKPQKKERGNYLIIHPQTSDLKIQGRDFDFGKPPKREMSISVNGKVIWKSKGKIDPCELIKKGLSG